MSPKRKSGMINHQGVQRQVIIWITVLALVVILALIIAGPRLGKGPVAGKAVQYGTAVTEDETVEGQWGIETSEASAGAEWTDSNNQKKNDPVDVTGFVDFGSGATLSTIRLRLNYDPAVLEPVSITPLHSTYSLDLEGDADADADNFKTADNYVLIYYTASSPSLPTLTGKQSLYQVRFKVIAPNPGAGSSQLYATAASLEPVLGVVSNADSGSRFGVYKTASTNDENVQLVSPNPSPQNFQLTVYPGCHDEDGDGFARTLADGGNGDLQACGLQFQAFDCNDENSQIKPGETEICNGADDNCDDNTDESFPLEFNTPPSSQSQLYGLCFNYKVCDDGVFKNSYEVDTNYNPESDPCDFHDNDCDGTLNEDAESACTIGAILPSIVGAPPGNIFIDYDAQTQEQVTPQVLDPLDRRLLNLLRALQEEQSQGTATCGTAGIAPCQDQWIENVNIHYCIDGVYYLEYTATNTVEKYSPTEELQSGAITEVPIENCAQEE